MTELQILSKVINNKSMTMLTLNSITRDYFVNYPEEYDFIFNHVNEYGNVPDKETFLAKFPNINIVSVTEDDKYLIDTFHEEHLYAKSVPVINKLAELMQTDSRAAMEYLKHELPNLEIKTSVTGVDIISQADRRLQDWKNRKDNPSQYVISTGFKEVDALTGGWNRGEEFGVIFARSGQGKSWVLIKMLQHAHKLGYVVGLLEPEMTDIKTAYRFDTVNAHISNSALVRGLDVPDYEKYIQNLKSNKTPFYVAGPKDFNRNVTVSKLKTFVINNKIEMLAIDGISYLRDDRSSRGDNKTTSLTNISEDLMDLSIELGIPVIVVVQSNREGVKTNDTAPELENIRDSDGIAFNASVVLAIRQKGPALEIAVRKNRNGVTGSSLVYQWDINFGKFEFIPDEAKGYSEEAVEIRQSYDSGKEVF